MTEIILPTHLFLNHLSICLYLCISGDHTFEPVMSVLCLVLLFLLCPMPHCPLQVSDDFKIDDDSKLDDET